MKRRRILSDQVLRGIWSYPVLSATLFLLALTSGVVIPMISGTEAGLIEAREAKLYDQGLETIRIIPSEPIDARACDDLRFNDGIADSGAQISSAEAEIEGLPGSSVAFVYATPGYARIVWNESLISSDAIVGSEVSQSLGIREGQQLSLIVPETHQRIQFSGVQLRGPSSRAIEANQQIVALDYPHGLTRECLIQPERGAVSAAEQLALARFPESSISRLLPDQSEYESLLTQLQTRVGHWFSYGLGLLLCLSFLLLQMIKRAEWALYAILGLSRTSLVFMMVVESITLVSFPFWSGVSLGLFGISLLSPIGMVALRAIVLDILVATLLLLLPAAAGYLLIIRKFGDHLKGQ